MYLKFRVPHGLKLFLLLILRTPVVRFWRVDSGSGLLISCLELNDLMEVLILEEESKGQVAFHILVLFTDAFLCYPLIVLKLGVLSLLKLFEFLEFFGVHEFLVRDLQL